MTVGAGFAFMAGDLAFHLFERRPRFPPKQQRRKARQLLALKGAAGTTSIWKLAAQLMKTGHLVP